MAKPVLTLAVADVIKAVPKWSIYRPCNKVKLYKCWWEKTCLNVCQIKDREKKIFLVKVRLKLRKKNLSI